MSVKELESLLSLLMDKKRKMEQEEAESSLQIMLEFLQLLRKRKVEELNEVCLELISIVVFSFVIIYSVVDNLVLSSINFRCFMRLGHGFILLCRLNGERHIQTCFFP